jgi:hypothetical protein
MKDIVKEVLQAIHTNIEFPKEDRENAALAAVNYEDFSEGRPGKTWWMGSRLLRLWFRKVSIDTPYIDNH